jgi:hypothetical protein
MWRVLTTMAFIGRPQFLYETCIASSHYECPQTRDQFATADFRCRPSGDDRLPVLKGLGTNKADAAPAAR